MNIGRARTRGLELSYQGRVPDTDLRAAPTSHDPKDPDNGARVPRRPGTRAQLTPQREGHHWQRGANLRYSGAHPDPP